MTDQRVVLTGADLTVADVEAVARGGALAVLDPAAIDRMRASRAVVEALVDEGAVVYGVTTGVGFMADRSIDRKDAERLQENLLVSHAAGVGEPLPREVVRAIQNARKDAGLEVSDRIALKLGGDDEILAAVREHETFVAGEVLATSVGYGANGAGAQATVDGHAVSIVMAKV